MQYGLENGNNEKWTEMLYVDTGLVYEYSASLAVTLAFYVKLRGGNWWNMYWLKIGINGFGLDVNEENVVRIVLYMSIADCTL